MTIAFDTSYARLPERFYARVAPTKVREPRIIKVNHPLALELGLDPAELDSAEGARILSGNVVPDGAASIALAYAGHQFGGFVPQLRACLPAIRLRLLALPSPASAPVSPSCAWPSAELRASPPPATTRGARPKSNLSPKRWA